MWHSISSAWATRFSDVMSIFHSYFVPVVAGRCVSALHLDTLNKQRAALLVRAFTAGKYKEMHPESVSAKV